MKYVLLIFGVALVFVGAYAIYTGYGIIEVERGWASVIAGATGLTGGIITIALAWIMRSLDRLRATVEAREVQFAQAGAQLSRGLAELSDDRSVAPATLPIRENAPGQMREEPVFGPDIAEMAVWDSEPPAAPPAPPVASPTPPRAPEPAARIPPLPRAASAFASAAAKARIESPGEPSINELWRRVGVNLDAAKSDKPGKAPEVPNRERPEADSATESTDWLDQALARFDAADGPESAEMNDEVPPLAPNSPPGQPADPQPEVIGRYEAEGTAYVMYSDGSIDAQSEEGILRFKSMAELKAFFQS